MPQFTIPTPQPTQYMASSSRQSPTLPLSASLGLGGAIGVVCLAIGFILARIRYMGMIRMCTLCSIHSILQADKPTFGTVQAGLEASLGPSAYPIAQNQAGSRTSLLPGQHTIPIENVDSQRLVSIARNATASSSHHASSKPHEREHLSEIQYIDTDIPALASSDPFTSYAPDDSSPSDIPPITGPSTESSREEKLARILSEEPPSSWPAEPHNRHRRTATNGGGSSKSTQTARLVKTFSSTTYGSGASTLPPTYAEYD